MIFTEMAPDVPFFSSYRRNEPYATLYQLYARNAISYRNNTQVMYNYT